jgi:hypothetical protein
MVINCNYGRKLILKVNRNIIWELGVRRNSNLEYEDEDRKTNANKYTAVV